MTKKKDLPPMPEHDGSENCPGCAETARVMDEINASPVVDRFKKLAEMIQKEHEAIEKEFGVKVTTVYMGGLENEHTERIGIYPKTIVVKGDNKETAADLIHELNSRIIMPSIGEKLKAIFGDLGKGGGERGKYQHGHMPMGKAGEA